MDTENAVHTTEEVFRDSRENKCLSRGLHAADSLLCLFIFFPSMVCYWRGIWDLYGVYIYPGQEPLTHWATCGLGCFSIVGYLLLPVLELNLAKVSRVLREILSRVFMYGYAILYMAYWRGVWSAADYYLNPLGWRAGVVGYFITYPLLLACRASRTAIFPPLLTALDTRDSVLQQTTRFGVKPQLSRPWSLVQYLLDSLFTHFVISTATIMLWRSLWDVTGRMLPFDNAFTADWVALVVGITGVGLLFVLEEAMASVSVRLDNASAKWRKLAYEDFIYFVTMMAHVFLWRGGWNLNAEFVFKDPMVGGWFNHGVGTVLLMSMQLFSYVGAVGCVLDGMDPGGEAIYPTKYLRTYLLPRLTNKQERLAGVQAWERGAVSTISIDIQPPSFSVNSTHNLLPEGSGSKLMGQGHREAAAHPVVVNGIVNINYDSDDNSLTTVDTG